MCSKPALNRRARLYTGQCPAGHVTRLFVERENPVGHVAAIRCKGLATSCIPNAGKRRPPLSLADRTRFFNPLEPYFTPIWIYTSWTKQTIVAEAAAARYTLKDDAGIGYLSHGTVFFVNDPLYPTEYPERFAAIRHHFHIKGQAPIFPIRIDGGHDLDRKSTRLNSSHTVISYAVFCLKK